MMKTLFSGTSFINTDFVSANHIGRVTAGEDGIRIVVGNKNRPMVVSIDEQKNANAYELDSKIKAVAEKAAKEQDVRLSDVYQYSNQSDLSEQSIQNMGQKLLQGNRSFLSVMRDKISGLFKRVMQKPKQLIIESLKDA